MTPSPPPPPPPSLPAAALATRLAFFVSGFVMSCWAPLIPLAKTRLDLDDRQLGFLLLSIGVGSILAMFLAGALTARRGSKPVILVSGLALTGILPLLAFAATPLTLGAALFAFGAALGSIDVSMNVHAVEVERLARRPLMSGFHALFSVGGFAGSAAVTALLASRMAPLPATLLCSALAMLAIIAAAPRLLPSARADHAPLLVLPRGVVLILAALAGIMFLVEGAMLDWGALFLTDAKLLTPDRAGLGYALFSVAMTAGRFAGDAITSRLGDRAVLLAGSALAIAGLVLLLLAPIAILALSGFVLIGLGASNIVPVLFRRAGAQPSMPPALAIAAITLTGYAGILLGPAAIGFVSKATSLPAAMWMLVALLGLVPLATPLIVRADARRE